MAMEEVKNKIISTDVILKLAELLENEKLHYQKLGLYDKKFNYYNKNEIRVYKVTQDELRYNVKLKSGESVEKEDIEWLKAQLANGYLSAIDEICIRFSMSLFSERDNNRAVNSSSKYKNLSVSMYFYEDIVRYSVDGDELEDEVYKLHSDIVNIFNGCPDRYNKTIKRKFIRSECLSLTIGFIIAYILVFVLKISYDGLPDTAQNMLNSTRYSYIICFFIIAFGVGNIIGQGVTSLLYGVIEPKKKYSHYDVSSKKSVYVDNISEYIAHDEVHIGKFFNAASKRMKIEKIFRITAIIVAVQIFLSVIYCLILRSQ